MKKVISLLLALITTLSLSTFTVSAYDNLKYTDTEPFVPQIDIELNETAEFSFIADEVKTCIFTPKQSGNYKITVEGGTKSAVEIKIYNQLNSERLLDDGFVLSTDKKSYLGVNIQQILASINAETEEFMYTNAKSSQPIIIELADQTSVVTDSLNSFGMYIADYFLPSTVTVKVEPVELEPIRPGHKPHISHKDVFEFIPDHSGKYRFTSECMNGAFPTITICDYKGWVVTSKDFSTMSVDENIDFDVTAELQEGETYLVHFENQAINDENEAIGTFSVEVEDLETAEAACDITDVTYIQQEDTHKDFTVTANGRKQMIQFIEPDGGTRTYDRYNKNITITSYNSDGEIVSSMARDLAYEVWQIHSNMSVGNEIKVRGKEDYKWDEGKYSFTIEPYNPIVSMELSSTSGKKGPVPATVVADDKTEKVMFKMPNDTSVTVSAYTTDENGNKIFTGNAWMNEDGLNEIRILIYRNSVWRQVGTLEYTVE